MSGWKLPWSAACLCGQVKMRVTAAPVVSMACHCTGCQKLTSGAYSLTLMLPTAGLEVEGETQIGALHRDESKHHYCPRCLSWLYTTSPGLAAMGFLNFRPTMLEDASWVVPFIESQTAEKLPGVGVAWAGLSYQERLSGSQAPVLYALSLLVVFLALAALYESWSIPLAVMLVIPLGLVGAALATALRGMTNDIYFQVGLLTTMGLAAKNAILIVEFAEQAERSGQSATEAAIEAARLRLRPILMTSFAFIFGVFPLAIATGPGAHSRTAIGTAVVGGVMSATLMAIFYTPLFFMLVRRWFAQRPA